MVRVSSLVLVLTLAVGSAAHAQAVRTIAPEEAAVTSRGDPDRIVCREMMVTGSRLGKKRACRTAREWNENAAANQAAAKALGRVGGLNSQQGFASPRAPGNLSVSRPH